jgi:hypothetical protein
MVKPHIKYRVTLSNTERQSLQQLVKKGNTNGCRIRHAQILLARDQIPANEHWSDERVGAAYGCRQRTVGELRKRFVEEGFEAALERKQRATPPRIKIDGEAEARIIVLACGEPPPGRGRRTLKLLAGKIVELGILDSISNHGIGDLLKNGIKPWLHKEWCIPEVPPEFVERMEDVLEKYTLPYNERRPVVCPDEMNRQLIGETRTPLPARPGQPAVYDYEYVRKGVGNIFMMFEPLASRREVVVSERHRRQDFAHCLRGLAEKHYPDAERIVLMTDSLNTHSLASLYAAFPPEPARRVAERFEIHYTPKHGSWLNMAEMEIGVLSRQCLNRRIPALEQMRTEVKA